ncbi:EF-hand domain-containing protein [Kutzneria sp. CA-103260]|uniref:EF-hand domain-containing protein n=1 Tax=Kutzneria sp. CA-103260 TaxID=2802641 RepID=UPI001BA67132|nr:EF-hand domain-containing protein [Kutzneria sp. CA-103260]QUQ70765.1 calcium-binding protein [Kutzneria sp. CA-103260]
MSSDFQRRKVAGVFTAMDVDGDGFLTEQDFRALTDRWTGIRGWASGTAGHEQLSAVMMGWWQTLLAVSDRNRDHKVSLDEVLLVVDGLSAQPAAVIGTADAMFDAVDENADGQISAAEYRQAIEAWTGRATDIDGIFPILDLNGDGHLSREEFAELWTEFWAGDNPDAPGSLVFGRV